MVSEIKVVTAEDLDTNDFEINEDSNKLKVKFPKFISPDNLNKKHFSVDPESNNVDVIFPPATAPVDTTPLGAIIAFPKAITNPAGFLKCDGSQFNQETYPDLYQVLGNSNILPNLNRTDIGQLAYFPFNEVPAGWIEFDKLKEILEADSENKYTKLKEKISAQFGGLDRIPKSENRFIRGLGNNLQIGQVQGDAIRNIYGKLLNNGGFYQLTKGDGKLFVTTGQTVWRTWSTNGGVNNFANIEFNASRVVPTAEENRPVAIAFKLCIKALDTSEDVDYWIKAASGIVNEGLLDASTLAQDIQEQRTALSEKADLAEVETLKKPLRAVKIWEGNIKVNSFGGDAIIADYKIGDILFFECYAEANPPAINEHIFGNYVYFEVEVLQTEAGYQPIARAFEWFGWKQYRVCIQPSTKKIYVNNNPDCLPLRRISKLVRG